MIITNSIAKSNLDNYVDKNGKISRDIKNKKLFKIVTGLYETDENTPAYLLAGSIYGPSYISFEYALSYYGLIPERVTTVTCATFNKKKKKMFTTSFGTFTYRDVPKLAYPEEIILKEEDNYEEIREALVPNDYNLIVTPKEIDDLIENMKDIVASGINMSL